MTRQNVIARNEAIQSPEIHRIATGLLRKLAMTGKNVANKKK